MNEQKGAHSLEWDDCIFEGLEPNDTNTVQEFLHAIHLLNIRERLLQDARIYAIKRTDRFLVISLKSNSDLQNVKDTLNRIKVLLNERWNNSVPPNKKAHCFEIIQTDTGIHIQLTV